MEDWAAAEAVPLTKEDQEVFDPLKSGFIWYTPPLASETSHKTGGQEWVITGHDMQVLSMTVPAGETITTEPASFLFGSSKMSTKVELTLCSFGGCMEGWKRICGGESCVKLLLGFEEPGYVGITPSFPAKILPVKFGSHVASGRALILQPGAYLAELGDVDVGCDLDCSITTCCCAGLGLCRQKLTGSDNSIAFLNAGGTIVYRNLKSGETITVDSGSVVGFEDTVELGITFNGKMCGCCTCCCGGEGCCSTTMSGPGKVYMQSMSFARFSAAVAQTIERDEA
jgi:uncharacterized protein (AIM24 family)